MARNNPTRQDTWTITLSINGVNYGIWDKKSGGAVDSDDGKYYPGGMVPPIALGGKKTTDNVTLSRFYDLYDDHGKINTILAAAGKGNAVVSQRPMDPEGNPFGKAIVYHGKLKRVAPPETDSEGTSVAMLEVEVVVNGYPAAV